MSADGRYRLSLANAEQGPSPWDEKVAAITATFRLESRMPAEADFSSQVPADVFLEKVDLQEAVLLSGEDVAGQKGSKWTDSSALTVTIHTLEVGKEQRQLRKLTLAVTVVKVTEWEPLEFKNIQKADETPLHCGPFEIVVSEVQPQHLLLAAAAFSDHAKEHEAYRQRMPLQFLTHRYAMQAVQISDAAGQRLGLSMGTYTGGGSSGRYAVSPGPLLVFPPKGEAGQTPSSIFSPAKDIRYPVTLSLKLPRKYESEQVIFEFQDVPLPAFNPRG
ncbi:hypothetical protein GCM10023213_32000 [Prosthecobacter algae]|uniref:Uncharacterized protein n=1 Tax=Prosthecobacter algae TaxID=1144682 RepID=A0ABP9PAV8_9BACT